MADSMGFDTPKHSLIELPQRGTALVLERFDRPALLGKVQRRHYVSAMSLASYEPQSRFLNSRQDQAIISWSKLLELASRTCVHPAAARVEMLGRLLLNTALQNTDDHLKNFGFLKVTGNATQYEIAPVFDVSAQAGQRHYLHCLDLGQVYNLSDVLPLARKLGVAKGAADEIEERIIGVLHRRQDYFDAVGMSRAESNQVDGWIAAGCGARYSLGTVQAPQSEPDDLVSPSPASAA
jgi:serine/threonine-protein kinase HipA